MARIRPSLWQNFRRARVRLAALGVLGAGIGALPAPSVAQPALAVAVPGWSHLFDRSAGWTGADGIYSHLEDGWDAPSDPNPAPRVMFLFSDTFIGQVNAQGAREAGWAMPHNTGAVLDGVAPLPGAMRFFWGDMGGPAQPVLVPHTAASLQGQWYWPVDGVVTGGRFYFFVQRMELGQGGSFNFAVAGIDLISEPAAGYGMPANPVVQRDTPFMIPAGAAGGLQQYGNAVMANTVEAGSPLADGYVYVYGLRNDPDTKSLLAARVPPAEIGDFNAWRFWTGAGWSADIAAASPIVDRLSSEFSVTPLRSGMYALVYQVDTLSNHTAIRFGRSPVGPFGVATIIYTCPEPKEYPGAQVYCYNAKAHPALSRPSHLLISYNVNSFSLTANLDHAAIYHPRFIALRIGVGPTESRARRSGPGVVARGGISPDHNRSRPGG